MQNLETKAGISAQLRLAQLSDGARASARFNIHRGATQEMPGWLSIRALKRRERRAPLARIGYSEPSP